MSATARARVDADGRLTDADPPIAILQEGAGARLGEALAIPALAALSILARQLGVPVARSVLIAHGAQDVEAQAHAVPAPDGSVAIGMDRWQVRAPRRPWLLADTPPPAAPVPERGVRWSTDGRMRIIACDWPDAIDRPFGATFELIADADDNLSLLEALAAQSDFTGQRARTADGGVVELSGAARREGGRFTGYDGTAAPIAVDQPDVPILGDAGLAGRLETALRTPLARIASQADAIAARHDGNLRIVYADYGRDIANAARHLMGLVDDLVDVEAIESPDLPLTIETVDLADLASRAAGLMQVRADDGGVRIDRTALDLPLLAAGDYRRVLQILLNLIANAVRHSPAGGMVWLRTEVSADSAIIIVADQGHGIAPDDHERIFAKFERLGATDAAGSGLGLYIARRLARAMGGDIMVDSARGQGARFILTLPRGMPA